MSDVDRAKTFYTEKAGFVADHDHRVNDEIRFVQLTPPGSAASIAIGTGLGAAMSPGSHKVCSWSSMTSRPPAWNWPGAIPTSRGAGSSYIPLLQAQLFAGTARAPLGASIADAGPPIVVNEGSSYVVVNNSVDPSSDQQPDLRLVARDQPGGDRLAGTGQRRGADDRCVRRRRGQPQPHAHQRVRQRHGHHAGDVADVAPAVTGGPALTTVEGTPITLNATFVDPGLRDTHTAQIDWGDGTTTNSRPATVPGRCQPPTPTRTRASTPRRSPCATTTAAPERRPCGRPSPTCPRPSGR